ncbi:MAG: MCE family protein [Gammaproteobacteria bacterium]|nr:MCE family protein [Gammaproteobacteria bacterium]MCK5092730.1 MCE family protein [Gammaproteobacteria bacterium]
MKRDNINYLTVGLFVLSMFVLLMVVLYRLTGADTNADVYFAYYDNIAGIKGGSMVTYGGYQLGYVKKIVPVQEDMKTRYKVFIAIQSEWKIPADSVARILTPGLLAGNHIDINEGKSKKVLSPGDEIVGQEEVGIMTAMNTLARELEGISDRSIEPLIDNINAHVNRIGSGLSERIPEMTANINALLDKLNNGATHLSAILNSKNTSYIDSILSNSNQFTKKFVALSERFDESTVELDKILKNANMVVTDNQQDIRSSVFALRTSLEVVSSNIRSIVYNMEATSRNMNEFSRGIRENPGLLLGGKPPVDKGVQ